MKEPAVARAILAEQSPRYSRVLGSRAEYVRYLHRPICRELWHLEAAERGDNGPDDHIEDHVDGMNIGRGWIYRVGS